jgi:hypothetical protein
MDLFVRKPYLEIATIEGFLSKVDWKILLWSRHFLHVSCT